MTRVSMVALLALALFAAPLAAEADRAPRIPRIGVVTAAGTVEAFRSNPVGAAILEGLKEQGWLEGRDFVLDIRTEEHMGRLPAVVAGLIAQRVGSPCSSPSCPQNGYSC